MASLKRLTRVFKRDTRGAIAVITAIIMFPVLIFAVGVPIDIARQIQLHSTFQNMADQAALAGSLDLAAGGTPLQVCTISNAFMQAQATGLNIKNATYATSTAPASPVASCSSTPPTVTKNAPNQVTVTATANILATFMSFLKPTLPVTVSSTSVGPPGFQTICVTPKASISADLDQLFYYLKNTDGTLANSDGTTITENQPETSTGGSGNGIELSAFLVDDEGNGPAVSGTVTYCDPPNNTQTADAIKVGLGQRLGFEFVQVPGGQYPCYYYPPNYAAIASVQNGKIIPSYSCLKSNAAYSYTPSSGTGGFLPYYQANEVGNFITNAYGSGIGTVNRFYSTDYPASKNTVNAPPTLSSNTYIANSCYYSPHTNNGVTTYTAINGYSAISQTCLISATTNGTIADEPSSNTTYGNSAAFSNNGAYNFAYFVSNGAGLTNGQSSNNLVCLVTTTGVLETSGTSGSSNTYAYSTVGSGSNAPANATVNNASSVSVQQENFVISNSGAPSGGGVYQCPTNTIGDPYYIAPTCAELGTNVINTGWNDTGGPYVDSVNYKDLQVTYSCSGATTSTYPYVALVQ